MPQWRGPISEAGNVARLFVGLGRQARDVGVRFELHRINEGPGAIVRDRDGNVVSVFSLDIGAGGIVAIRSVINPDKLRHLGPPADVRALAARRSAGARPEEV